MLLGVRAPLCSTADARHSLQHTFPVRCHSRPLRHHSANAIRAAAGGDRSTSGLRVIMMRHAESDPAGENQDHARPITDEGAVAAQQTAKRLEQLGWLPDLVLCSTAQRTMQTLEAMQGAVRHFAGVDVHAQGSLFTVAAMDGMTLQALQIMAKNAANQAKRCILFLGHNRGWEEAASSLAGEPVRLQTASAALLHTNAASWDAWEADTKWTLVDLLHAEPQS